MGAAPRPAVRDPLPADQGRRLALASGLTRRAVIAAGGGPIPSGAAGEDLLWLASRLRAVAPRMERALRLRFEPAYPGRTRGAEAAGGTSRVVLACEAHDPDGPVGVVFTTLIAGRAPLVAVAPPEASIPPDWTLVPA